MVISVLLALCLILVADLPDFAAAERRLPRDGTVAVDTDIRAPAEVIQFAVLLLALSAILSWRAARRRAQHRPGQ
jgi:hypothetical protein